MYDVINMHSILGNYDVEFTKSISEIENLIDAPNTFTFIDRNVSNLYPSLYRSKNIEIDSIEENKTMEYSNIILQNMINMGVNSNSTILVIGGGILQDLVGFCCSVYNRGVSYILIPTTLLSQVDSCIGGKTSINFNKKKNIIGTFFPPKKILIYTDFLHTLNRIEYLSGMGEVYKFHILQSTMKEFGASLDISNIKETIFKSLLYKKSILDLDEFDKKERKFLNFGHTFGHALEFTSKNKIPHGIAVVMGCLISINISKYMKYKVNDFDIICDYGKVLLDKIDVNPEWFDFNELMEAVKMDKKSNGNVVDVLINDTPSIEVITDMDSIKFAISETIKMVKV